MAKRGTPRSRIPVRVGALEATLTHFKAEILNEVGAKTAYLLDRYDGLKVAALRERLAKLERWTSSTWSLFYLLAGGAPGARPEVGAENLVSRMGRLLLRAGFLMRDPELAGPDAGWFINHRWQWRFWRGPYWAVDERAAVEAKAPSETATPS